MIGKVSIFLLANAWMTTMIAAQGNPPCDICNGRGLNNPNAPIDTSMLPADIIGQIPAGITLTCGLVDTAAKGGFLTTDECALIQTGIDLFCSCGSGATPV